MRVNVNFSENFAYVQNVVSGFTRKLQKSFAACNISGHCSHFIPLKTPENLWFFGVFRGYKMGTLTKNGLKLHFNTKKVALADY